MRQALDVMHSGLVDDEPAIERGDVLALMGVMADINVNIDRIVYLLESAIIGDDGEEEEET